MTASADPAIADDTISVYWQTGCTSCLRTKEFLERHDVPYRSCNVLEDEAALDELSRFGLRQVPIVVRGDACANGQILRDVARLCGIPMGEQTLLPPDEMHRRLVRIIEATRAHALQLPAAALPLHLPNRPRSHADLIYHTFNIVDAFIEHEEGLALVYEAYYRVPPASMQTPEGLAAYGAHVRQRLDDWFAAHGAGADWTAPAQVYYGAQTLHEFLERTTWHSGQHARQLVWLLERQGLTAARPLGAETFRGLPMPEKVWDGEDAAA